MRRGEMDEKRVFLDAGILFLSYACTYCISNWMIINALLVFKIEDEFIGSGPIIWYQVYPIKSVA